MSWKAQSVWVLSRSPLSSPRNNLFWATNPRVGMKARLLSLLRSMSLLTALATVSDHERLETHFIPHFRADPSTALATKFDHKSSNTNLSLAPAAILHKLLHLRLITRAQTQRFLPRLKQCFKSSCNYVRLIESSNSTHSLASAAILQRLLQLRPHHKSSNTSFSLAHSAILSKLLRLRPIIKAETQFCLSSLQQSFSSGRYNGHDVLGFSHSTGALGLSSSALNRTHRPSEGLRSEILVTMVSRRTMSPDSF